MFWQKPYDGGLVTFGHPALTAAMEAWWDTHGQEWSDPEWHRYLEIYQRGLAEKFDELRKPHRNEGPDGERRFGMSGAGSCTRKAGLKMLGFYGEKPSGSVKRNWFLGHVLEPDAIAMLRVLGIEVEGQQEPAFIDPFMASYSDGILPDFEGRRAVLSVKTTGFKGSTRNRHKVPKDGEEFWYRRRGFAELPEKGVLASNGSWWVQAQAEMHALSLDRALFVVVAKDQTRTMATDPLCESLSFYTEVAQYDRRFCEGELIPTWQRAWDAVKAGRLPEAIVFAPTGHMLALPMPGSQGQDANHPNRVSVGPFNYCDAEYCELSSQCRDQMAAEYRRAPSQIPAGA